MPKSYRTLPQVARATGRSERTLQLWFALHRAARTRNGYPVSLILNVLAEHGVAADAAQFAEAPHDARNAAQDAQDAQEGAMGAASGDSLTAAHEAHIAALEANLRDVRVQLDARTREVSELHVLLGRAQRALPEVRDDAAEGGRDAPQAAPWWAFWRRR